MFTPPRNINQNNKDNQNKMNNLLNAPARPVRNNNAPRMPDADLARLAAVYNQNIIQLMNNEQHQHQQQPPQIVRRQLNFNDIQ